MALIIYDFLTGRRVVRVESPSWSFVEELSDPGSMSATLTPTPINATANLYDNTRPWRTVIADVEWGQDAQGRRTETVRCAGLVTKRSFSQDQAVFELIGIGSYLAKVPVISAALKDTPVSGQITNHETKGVVVPAEWTVHVSGSTADMLTSLVELALAWQAFPVVLPAKTGGSYYRDWYGTDLATIADHIDDVTNLMAGPEWVWDAVIIDGRLYWRLHCAPEVARNAWRIDATRPGAPVTEVTLEEDASDMATDGWASGGQQDDKILLSRARSHELTDLGWPYLFGVDKTHDTVSEIQTLDSYAEAIVQDGVGPSEVFSVRVRRDQFLVRAGDWLDLRWQAWFMPIPQWWRLKVLRVAGDEGEWLTLSTRRRI